MEFGLVAVWLGVFLLLGIAALPVATWLFPRSWSEALAIPLALGLFGIVGFLVGHIAFGWPAVVAGLLGIIGLSALAGGRTEPDWRGFAEPAVVFVLAFLLVVAFRSVDPVAAPLPLAVGEKFLDFGLLKSLERATSLPPVDMWYAGAPIQYHYGGHAVTSLLATLTGTETRFAYNLGLAAFFATLVTAAYGLAGSIAQPYAVSRRLAAGLGAFFIGIAGNLETTLRVVGWLVPDGLAGVLADLFGVDADLAAWSPTDFGYFDASRVMRVDPSNPDSIAAATEFPLFAWLNGDLHAHMMSQVFVLLAAAVLLAYWRTPAGQRRRRLVLLLGVLPPTIGLVGVTNIWSFPTVGGLAFLVVLFAPGDPARLWPSNPSVPTWLAPRPSAAGEELRRLGVAIVATSVVLLLAIVWTAPFWLGTAAGGPNRALALWDARTPLGPLLVVHGAFLAAFAPYVGRRLGIEVERPVLVWIAGIVAAVVAAGLGFAAVGLVVPLGLAGWWMLRTRDDVGFEVLLLLAGAGLVLLVELVTIEGERFNVIFKPYVEVWLFWGVGAAVALARLVRGWPAGLLERDRPRWRQTGAFLAIMLVLSTSSYALLAFPSHFDSGTPSVEAEGPTLDATAYIEYTQPQEAPAIRWLDAHAGQPTIVDAPGEAGERYRWTNAPSSLTGLPTVIGWVFNERQYGRTDTAQRVQHVETIFTGEPARQAELLERYDVTYVYVGPREREKYGEAAITIDEHPAVSVAQEWETVTIYEVGGAAS